MSTFSFTEKLGPRLKMAEVMNLAEPKAVKSELEEIEIRKITKESVNRSMVLK